MNEQVKFSMIIAIQLLFLLGMVGTKVYTLKAGEKVLLEVVPVDPRSLFRGEYARLNYVISNLKFLELEKIGRNRIVYVTLKKGEKFWEAAGVSDEKPQVAEGEIFIVGRKIGRNWIQYGIESYFLPEGKAIEVERIRRPSEVTVEVSIDRFGNSAIHGIFIDEEPLEKYLREKER